MITEDVLMCKQILPTSTIRNMWKTVRRMCMLMLGLKELGKFASYSETLIMWTWWVHQNILDN